MKENYLQNRQLKRTYNTQISNGNQVIIHDRIHQNSIDTKTLKPDLEDFEQTFGKTTF